MLGLPASTEIKKAIPKTVIYEKFAAELTSNRKKEFDNDISRIVVVNEISGASVNIREGEDVKAIFVVVVELRNREYNEKNMAMISKLFGQKLLLLLHFGSEYRMAIYQTKILYSDWFKENEKTLRLDGFTLDQVWQSLVSQVSGIMPEKQNTLDEQIAIEDEKNKLRKQMAMLENQARKETQSKKKFELHEKILEYKRRLEEM